MCQNGSIRIDLDNMLNMQIIHSRVRRSGTVSLSKYVTNVRSNTFSLPAISYRSYIITSRFSFNAYRGDNGNPNHAAIRVGGLNTLRVGVLQYDMFCTRHCIVIFPVFSLLP